MRHLNLSPQLYDYMLQISLREDPILRALRDDHVAHPLLSMQTAPEQAQFLQMILRLLRAKRVLELGTFMGYATLAMALVLPDEGRIITCDRNPTWTNIALPYWQQAKQEHKIDLRLGAAIPTLKTLLSEGLAQSFDFIYIDADKTNYVAYYEYALQLVQPHGLIAVDNVFWDGDVIDPQIKNAQTREIRRLNTLIQNDDRVEVSLLPIADGLFLIQPKS
ncbi:MAG: SAM-dependent methyltransferase [Gammaproteobacteria bacterium]|nr:SAM-dependent methyltransferase [Gammaproteobacteria bacterium]